MMRNSKFLLAVPVALLVAVLFSNCSSETPTGSETPAPKNCSPSTSFDIFGIQPNDTINVKYSVFGTGNFKIYQITLSTVGGDIVVDTLASQDFPWEDTRQFYGNFKGEVKLKVDGEVSGGSITTRIDYFTSLPPTQGGQSEDNCSD